MENPDKIHHVEPLIPSYEIFNYNKRYLQNNIWKYKLNYIIFEVVLYLEKN